MRSNGIGFDSSVTLEAIPPNKYSLKSFTFIEYGAKQQKARYDWLQSFHIGLYAESRQIHLLDWYSSEVKLDPYDSEDAVKIYASGNIPGTRDGRRNFYGYMAPIYGVKATFRSPLGTMQAPINNVPGQLTLIQYTSATCKQGEKAKVHSSLL